MSKSLALLATGLAASVAGTRAAAATARKLGVVDQPGPLKPQEEAVPYLGGLGVLAGTAVVAAAVDPFLLVPMGLATALGTADDLMDLPPALRAAGQLAIGIATAATVRTRIPEPIGSALQIGVTFLLTNGVNLMDGLDGLSGGVAAVAGATLAALLDGDSQLLAASLAVSSLGFLSYNRPPAKVYLGDGGAYLIGTSLAVLLSSAWKKGVPTQSGVASALVVAVPAAEVTFSILRRRRNKQSLVAGDRGHAYDRLVDRGWSTRSAAGAYVGTEVALGALALAVARARSVAVPAIAAGAVGAVMFGVAAATGLLGSDKSQ